MENTTRIKVKVTISKNENFFGPGIVALLELIDETGSVKEACRQMELSYTKGWHIINRAEKELDFELITRVRGGREGGGASVTPRGRSLIEKYKVMQAEIQTLAGEIYQKTFPDGL